MDFGEVLSRAWQIVWKHKVLWIFGILAGCGGQTSNTFNYQFSGDSSNWGNWPESDIPLPPFLQDLERQLNALDPAQIIAIVAVFVCIGLLLAILALVLSTIGQVGLVQGASQADQGVSSLSLGGLFESGRPFYLRVIGLNLLLALVFLLIFGAIGVFFAIVGLATLGIGLICLLPLLCLLIPAGWLAGIVIEQATVALVLEDLGIMDALSRGWQVFRNNLGAMIVMGLILGIGLGLIAGFVLGIPMFLVISPLIFGGITGGEQGALSALPVVLICFVIYLPILIVLGGILQAYIKSAWTLTYMRLTSSKPLPPADPFDLDEAPPAPAA